MFIDLGTFPNPTDPPKLQNTFCCKKQKLSQGFLLGEFYGYLRLGNRTEEKYVTDGLHVYIYIYMYICIVFLFCSMLVMLFCISLSGWDVRCFVFLFFEGGWGYEVSPSSNKYSVYKGINVLIPISISIQEPSPTLAYPPQKNVKNC